MTRNEHGALVVFTGPSGVGKGTVLNELEKLGVDFLRSVSATTRSPREGEEDGVAYYFLTKEKFREMIAEDAFLEHAEYVDEYYGTPAAPVDEALNAGRNVILEIDFQGAMQVREKRPNAILVFLLPPSMEELERRLRGRGTETETKIAKRLAKGREECALADRFDFQLVNDDAARTAFELKGIIEEARNK